MENKNILVLGAGLVARPLVEYLLDGKGFHVTVASRTLDKARALIGTHPNGAAEGLDVTDSNSLAAKIKRADLVISLVPYAHHASIARLCIEYKKNMVTTSYVSDAMRALDEPAKKAGILILNEIGLDPGIDHMSAMKIIHDVQNNGGSIESFYSYCGGLPAPEANDNPFGYKFSWSPRGVVLAGRNSARFLKDGRVVEIPGKELFDNYNAFQVDGLGEFEAYPNRDSMSYIDIYGLEGISTMLRGTLRNRGWCRTWKKIADIGFLDDKRKYDFRKMTLRRFLAALTGADESSDAKGIQKRAGLDDDVFSRIEWLGLTEDLVPSLNEGTALDLLVAVLKDKLEYKIGERDMIVMVHEFVCRYGNRKVKITSTFIDFGEKNGASAMSRTVSLPAAIAAKLIMRKRISLKGVQIPVLTEIYTPVLEELEERGLKFGETREAVTGEKARDAHY